MASICPQSSDVKCPYCGQKGYILVVAYPNEQCHHCVVCEKEWWEVTNDA